MNQLTEYAIIAFCLISIIHGIVSLWYIKFAVKRDNKQESLNEIHAKNARMNIKRMEEEAEYLNAAELLESFDDRLKKLEDAVLEPVEYSVEYKENK